MNGKVFFITAECKPFSKVGGVGDVAGELPPAIHAQGVDIEIVTPLYGSMPLSHAASELDTFEIIFHSKREQVKVCRAELRGVPVNLLKNETYFEGNYSSPYIYSKHVAFRDDVLRFSFFSFACLELVKRHSPDIVHINDWLLGYLFGLMRIANLPAKRVLTIHNIGYQGNIGIESIRGWDLTKILEHPTIGPLFIDPRTEWHSVNPLRLALELAHMSNTVSPTYCIETSKPESARAFFEGGKGLELVTKRLIKEGKYLGILNGFEYTEEPTQTAFKTKLKQKKSAKIALARAFQKPDAFLAGFVGRAVEQKFRLLTEQLGNKTVLEHILAIPDLNVAILATGLPEYEAFIAKIAKKVKKSAQGNFMEIIAFDRQMAQNISLGSDIFLMPSLFEPCGITQMESMSHATPPLVRLTGGLRDTVIPHHQPGGTGFGVDGRAKREILQNLISAVSAAKELYYKGPSKFESIQKNAFALRFTWTDSANKYIQELYKPALSDQRA